METIPSAIWSALSGLDYHLQAEPLPRGLDAVWHCGAGLVGRFLPRRQRFLSRAEKVLILEKHFSTMTDRKLREAASQLREVFRLHRDRPCDLERAFALVREVAERQIGDRPFPVQIAGAFALQSGCIAEMATGEGKTLTATMPAVIAGWRGRGCHIITVNDYLAQRDAEWMGPIYRFCGLKVAYIQQLMPASVRRNAYLADITYCTNKEVTADFLRDRLCLGRIRDLGSALLSRIAAAGEPVLDRVVQRGLNFAIVDEADSVLVDEAITPLIISSHAANPEQAEAFQQAANIAAELQRDLDYHVDARFRQVELTHQGRIRLAELTGGPLPHGRGSVLGLLGQRRQEEIITKALIAKELYFRDKHYVVAASSGATRGTTDERRETSIFHRPSSIGSRGRSSVVIVDDFTGRLMPDRTWRDGLHQAIEAKERLEVTAPNDTLATITFQRFFRLYRKLAGMTGTAKEAAAEFWQIYNLPVVSIPTNRPCVRKELPDIVLSTKAAKWERIVSETKRIHESGRPVLIGTRSVRDSEQLSRLLSAQGLRHQVLNAIRHREEARIVASAGAMGAITVATNMAGRGTDIKLGRGVSELGGLHVIAAEHNESARIDRQLFGRCARQGDPGSCQAIVSLEDELVSRYLMLDTAGPPNEFFTACSKKYLYFSLGSSEKSVWQAPGYLSRIQNPESRIWKVLFRLAQWRAERIALAQRKAVISQDHWLEEYLSFAPH
ncbi:MAG: hypothetical protein ACE5NM_03535 [Sedimentisphaerales bacterium]